jgi:hypothetical protein
LRRSARKRVNGLGAGVGMFGGPVGAFGGAVAGGIAGGVLGIAKQYYENEADRRPSDAKGAARWDQAQDMTRSLAAGAMPPISLNLNIDGRTIAQALSTALQIYNGFPTQAPAADGMGQTYSGDHNFPSN